MTTQLGSDREEQLAQVVDEFFDDVAKGETPEISDYLRRYPEIADHLKIVIPAMLATEHTASRSEPSSFESTVPQEKQLGDFRILRQIGRGGMGVVYEAEQVSMKRRVALKVLPLAGLVDELKIHRFQNEVRAVAALNHPNIVPVYMVGQERGVHYYAMQLIHGRSLSDILLSLQRVRDQGEPLDGASISQITNIGHAVDAGRDGVEESRAPERAHDAHLAEYETVAATDSSTIPHSSRREYFRSVAALGVQAASALQHAHDQGVVHRDIKPANLLLDTSATLFVTDFGLARIESDVGVTMTGDLIGTLRYMAPEQALAKRVMVDHRADIYSLGVTLYELVAMQPAYRAEDRQQLLKQIAFEDPTPLRRLDREIPTELETIIHKAMSKDMDRRYTSAQDLADDLRSHLENRPIKAKPPTTSEIISKWTRRNPAWTCAAIITLSLVTLTLAASIVFVSKQRDIAQNRSSDLARHIYLMHLANADRALLVNDYVRARKELENCQKEYRGWEWNFLQRRFRATISNFPGAEQPIFCHEGKRLIAIGALNTPEQRMANIWDLSSGLLVKALEHESPLSHIALSPDESRIAAGDHSGNLFVWNIETEEKVWWVEELHNSKMDGLAFGPDGDRIATASWDGTVKVLDATNGQVQFTVLIGGAARKVMFSPNGRWIAAGEGLGKAPALLVDVATGEVAATFPGTGHMIPTFDRTGQRIATSNVDGSISLWNWDGDRLSSLRSWPASDRHVWALDFSADGDRLASGDYWSGVVVWDVATGQELARLDLGENVGWLAMAPRDSLIALFGQPGDGGIRLWRYGERKEGLIEKPVDGAAVASFSPDGQRIAASSPPARARWATRMTINHSQATVLDAVSGTNILKLGGKLNSVSWTPDQQHLVAPADVQPRIRIYSRSTGTIAQAFTAKAEVAFAGVFPPGQQLVAVLKDGPICVWNVQTGKKIREFSVSPEKWGDGTYLTGVGISPAGTLVGVAIFPVHTVEIWDVQTQSLVRSLATPELNVRTIVFSKDGNCVYVGGNGGKLIGFDIDSGRQNRSFTGYEQKVTAIALSPGEDQIVSGDTSGRVIVWDVASQEQLITLTDGDQMIMSVDWSADGQRIAAGKSDGSVQIWTLPSSS